MSDRPYKLGDEPVPGYQLCDFLGRGGFGEVWQAQGPGGVEVALKIIHNLERKKGGKELEALELLKNIRHPNIVPLTAYWLKTADGLLVGDEGSADVGITRATVPFSGDVGSSLRTASDTFESVGELALADAEELVIAMGLAEQSLLDLQEQSRQAGKTGIEFDELLTYMEDAARAIDLLNTKHNIQHCDIKPQNILVQSGAAQVADFGLAMSLGDARDQSMVSATIAYAAPEVLLGKGPGPATDQYSLAVTYYELRTGVLPFDSDRISDVIDAKQHGKIDLSRLSGGERDVIARATAAAEDRYPSAGEMVQALRKCGAGRSPAADKTTPYIPRTTSKNSPSSARAPRRRWVKGVLASIAAMVLLTGLVWAAVSIIKSSDQTAENTRQTAETSQQIANATQQTAENTKQLVGAANRTAHNTGQIADSSKQTAENTGQIVGAARQLLGASRRNAENTRQILGAARQTASNTKQIAATTREISQTLENIRQELAEATRHDGVIDNPRTPGEFYHNARQYEQRGDYPNARRSYDGFFKFQLEVVDPHHRYRQLLVIQEGRTSARRKYLAMELAHKSPVVGLMTILSEPDESRVKSLSKFVQHHPNFAPAVWELSREYSKEQLGVQALADKSREKELLQSFMQLVDDGHLLRYYLDQTVAIEMIDDAKSRLASLAQLDKATFGKPVRLTTMLSNAGWTVSLSVAEVARDIEYRKQGENSYQHTGHLNYVDQRTGSPMPRPSFQLPMLAKAATYEVRYKDIRGNWQGPYPLKFNPQSERVRGGKNILEMLPTSWISFRRFRGETLAYFSHLIGYRQAIREIRYRIDDQPEEKTFPLPPVDPSNPYATPPGTQIYITVPESAKFIIVQLTYGDDTTSKSVRFDLPPGMKQK